MSGSTGLPTILVIQKCTKMKKILTLILLLGFAVSCDCGCYSWEDASPEEALLVSQRYLKVQGGYDDGGHMRTYKLIIRKWSYEGHEYLEFAKEGHYGQGWVHDPNCSGCTKPVQTVSSISSEYEKMFGTK